MSVADRAEILAIARALRSTGAELGCRPIEVFAVLRRQSGNLRLRSVDDLAKSDAQDVQNVLEEHEELLSAVLDVAHCLDVPAKGLAEIAEMLGRPLHEFNCDQLRKLLEHLEARRQGL